MTIGDRIRMKREEMKLSQEELAFALGYRSRSSINKIEKDANSLPQSKIAAIAKVLNTTPAYLMGWEDEPKILNPAWPQKKIKEVVSDKRQRIVCRIHSETYDFLCDEAEAGGGSLEDLIDQILYDYMEAKFEP